LDDADDDVLIDGFSLVYVFELIGELGSTLFKRVVVDDAGRVGVEGGVDEDASFPSVERESECARRRSDVDGSAFERVFGVAVDL
jgi:hypothetical protein